MGLLDRFFRKSRCRIGVDIGARSVRVAVVEKEDEDSFFLKDAFVFPIPSGVIKEGKIVNEDELINVLKTVKKTVPRGDFVAVLPSTASLVTTFELPEGVAEEEIEYLVVEEIAKKIPISISAVSFDYYMVELDGKKYVNSVVGKKESIRRFLSLYEKAGIELDSITSIYTAISNAFFVNYPDSAGGCVYLVDVDYNISTFCFLNGNLMVHGRTSSFGTSKIEEYISSALNIDMLHIKELITRDGIDEYVLEEALKHFAQLFAEELEACSVFCERQHNAGKDGVINVYISGEATELPRCIPFIASFLSEKFKVTQFDPFRRVKLAEDVAVYVSNMRGVFAVSVGAGVS